MRSCDLFPPPLGRAGRAPSGFPAVLSPASWNLFIQILVLPGIWDTQCGFKAFRDFAALKIFSQLTISCWGFDVEILSMARAFGFKTTIAPAYFINSPDSKVNFKSYLQVLLETVKVRLNLWSGKYD